MPKQNSFRRNAISVAIATALAGGVQTAAAQDEGGIEEIVVTASKRAENIQDVSISVTALGEEALKLGGIEDITRLEHLVPGMRMGQSGNEARIAIRGTRQNAVGTEAEMVVGIFEDGVYVPTSTQALGSYIDINRVEVLRGPQGTLYGRNTFGGTINVITNQPQFDGVTGKVEALVGDYNRMRLEGVVNIPMGDKFAVRLAAMSDEHDGYIENYNQPGTSDDLSDRDMTFGRVSARWAPTDTLDITLRHTFSDLNSNGNAQWGYQIIGSYTNDQYIPGHDFAPDEISDPGFAASDDFDRGPWEVSRNQASRSDHESQSTTLSADWDVGPVTLKVVGNTTDYEGAQVSDFDYSDGADPLNNGFAGWMTDQTTDSMEIQVQSNTDGMFDWMVGYYYFDMSSAWNWIELVDGVEDIPHWDRQSPFKTKSQGVFGSATFHVSDRVRLLAGIRDQKDRKTLRDQLDWSVWPPVTDPGTGEDETWNETLWKAGIEFDLNEDMLLYATGSTGYRMGGFNPLDPAIPPVYDPEHVTAYEVGLKSTLQEGRVQLNLAAYHNEYEDMHAQGFIDLGGAAIAEYFSNGGEITTTGLEVELKWVPSDDWNIAATAAFMDSEFGEYLNGVLFGFTDLGGRQDLNNPAGGANLKGWEPTLSPDLTLGGQISYNIELGGGGTLMPFLQTSYSSDYYASDYNLPGAKQDAYTKTDVRLIWTSGNGKIEVQGFVLNVENEAVMMRIATFNPTPVHTGLQTHWGNPRTWGVSGTYYFE